MKLVLRWRPFGRLTTARGRSRVRASILLLAALTACNSIDDGNAASIPVKRLWFTPFSSPGAWPGLPAVEGGLVLVANVGGMAAYVAATAQPRWRGATAESSGDTPHPRRAAFRDRRCSSTISRYSMMSTATAWWRWT